MVHVRKKDQKERYRGKTDEHGMGSMLAEYIELSLKELLIESILLTQFACAIVRLEDDERLKDSWLFAFRGGTEDRAICGHLAPAQHSQAQLISHLLELLSLLLANTVVMRVEKDISNGVLSRFGK
jgi:hypothetical protein